jgi:hypothetical protein
MIAIRKAHVFKILTLVYLFSAATITIATSKKGDSPETTDILNDTTAANFRIQSGCGSGVGDASIRVLNGKITEAIDANGVDQDPAQITFSDFGFPNPTAIIGLDQNRTVGGTTFLCHIRTKLPQAQATAGTIRSRYTYDCYQNQAFLCSILVDELAPGSLVQSSGI